MTSLRLTLSALLTIAGSTGLALAADAPKPDWTLVGNAGLLSDYRFRGFTQTGYKPAFQGGFDLSHISGFYMGNWNSNVEQGLYRGATLEMDIYGGYKFQVAGLNADLGAITCRYPTRTGPANVGEVHHDEVYVGLGYSIFSAKFSYGLSNYFGLGDGTAIDTRGNWYLDLGAAYDLGNGWGVNAHFGHQTIRNATAPANGLKDKAVDDYKVGVTRDKKGWVASASWFSTSRDGYFTTGAGTPEAAGKGAIVFGIAKTF